MAFTEIATIYYPENNINTHAHCVGKMQNCLLHGWWSIVTTIVNYPREVKFNVASYGTWHYYNVLTSMVTINFTIISSEFLIYKVAIFTYVAYFCHKEEGILLL